MSFAFYVWGKLGQQRGKSFARLWRASFLGTAVILLHQDSLTFLTTKLHGKSSLSISWCIKANVHCLLPSECITYPEGEPSGSAALERFDREVLLLPVLGGPDGGTKGLRMGEASESERLLLLSECECKCGGVRAGPALLCNLCSGLSLALSRCGLMSAFLGNPSADGGGGCVLSITVVDAGACDSGAPAGKG